MKTAAELNIEDWEFDALIRVRDMLATQAFRHENQDPDSPKPGFDMNHTAIPRKLTYECPSVSCIGGSMYLHHKGMLGKRISHEFATEADNYVYNHVALFDLFFPPSNYEYFDITPAQAVEAIDNFTHSGKPDWHAVLETEQNT